MSRITYRDRETTFQITIAPKPGMLQVLVIIASLSPFLFFLVRFAKNLGTAKGGAGSLLPFIGSLLVWGISGIFWLYSIAINVFGTETVTISGEKLSIRKSFWGRGPVKQYRTDHISYMRIHGLRTSGPSILSQFAHSSVSILFNYEGKTHRFGNQLLEREARFMLDRLKSKLPATAFKEK